jgi:hypothetical protein
MLMMQSFYNYITTINKHIHHYLVCRNHRIQSTKFTTDSVIFTGHFCSSFSVPISHIAEIRIRTLKVHKSSQLIATLCQTNPVHTIPSYLLKIHFTLSTHHVLVPLVASFPRAIPTVTYMQSSSPSFLLHDSPISSSLTLSF